MRLEGGLQRRRGRGEGSCLVSSKIVGADGTPLAGPAPRRVHYQGRNRILTEQLPNARGTLSGRQSPALCPAWGWLSPSHHLPWKPAGPTVSLGHCQAQGSREDGEVTRTNNGPTWFHSARETLLLCVGVFAGICLLSAGEKKARGLRV